jgi:DNA-binding NarL/FixJ family response regulator
MTESKAVTLVVGEEWPLIREALVALCQQLGCEVVGRCGDGNSAWQAIQQFRPDIALLDYGLPELVTLEVVRRLREQSFPTRVLILSVRRDRRTVLEALRSGAAGYVLKSGPSQDLSHAIHKISTGGIYVSPSLDIGKLTNGAQPLSGDPVESLSSREYQVFTLLVDGIRAKEIASRLDVSPKTVDTYRASLMRKLDIHDVAGLVKFAIQRELTTV